MRIVLIAVFIVSLIFNTAIAQDSLTSKKCKHKLGVSRILDLSNSKLLNIGDFDFIKAPLAPYEVILTFDDGPDAEATPQILNDLEKQCTKATFFETGENIEENPEIANRIADAGNTIGLHSYDHKSMQKLSEEEQILDFRRVFISADKVLGHKLSRFYRFPFLENTDFLTTYLNGSNFHVISIEIDSFDWTNDATTKSIINHVFNSLKERGNSGIILMHDDEPAEVKAFPIILKKLKSKGYKIVLMK